MFTKLVFCFCLFCAGFVFVFPCFEKFNSYSVPKWYEYVNFDPMLLITIVYSEQLIPNNPDN